MAEPTEGEICHANALDRASDVQRSLRNADKIGNGNNKGDNISDETLRSTSYKMGKYVDSVNQGMTVNDGITPAEVDEIMGEN